MKRTPLNVECRCGSCGQLVGTLVREEAYVVDLLDEPEHRPARVIVALRHGRGFNADPKYDLHFEEMVLVGHLVDPDVGPVPLTIKCGPCGTENEFDAVRLRAAAKRAVGNRPVKVAGTPC